jgi:hypothetical protein
VIAQRVVPTEIAIHDQVQIVQPVAHTVIVIRDQVQIVQPVAHTVIVIRDQVPIVRHVRMAIEIPAHLQIVPIVHHVRMAIVIRAQVHVKVLIVQPVAHTETAIHAHLHVQLQTDHVVARRVDRQIDAMTVILDRAIHDPRQINPAEATHTVAIVQRQAMIVVARRVDLQIDAMALRLVVTQIVLTGLLVLHATIAAVHVTANAVVVPIVPEVASPMIAKNVHAVALAKSA